MFKNQMIQLLVDLQKKGIHIHLTEEGYKEFLKLLQDEDVSPFDLTIAG